MDILQACALGTGAIPDELAATLIAALQSSDQVIRSSVAQQPLLSPGQGYTAAG